MQKHLKAICINVITVVAALAASVEISGAAGFSGLLSEKTRLEPPLTLASGKPLARRQKLSGAGNMQCQSFIWRENRFE